jgi:hypothetical protein
MVREEYSHIASEFRLAPREGLKTRTQHHILPDVSSGGQSQPILGKPAPQRKHRTVPQCRRCSVIFNGSEDRSFGGFRKQSYDYRVVQDKGAIEELVGRPHHRWPQHRLAWLSGQHIDIPVLSAWVNPA